MILLYEFVTSASGSGNLPAEVMLKNAAVRVRRPEVPIVVNLDVVMAQRKISSGELAERIGISLANLSVLKTGKARAVRFSTLEAICEALGCQPGEILAYECE